jgi:hypothetical protein
VLGAGVSRRLHHVVVPRHLLAVAAVSVVLAGAAWLVMELLDPSGRALTLAALTGIGAVGLAAYAPFARRWMQSVPVGAQP